MGWETVSLQAVQPAQGKGERWREPVGERACLEGSIVEGCPVPHSGFSLRSVVSLSALLFQHTPQHCWGLRAWLHRSVAFALEKRDPLPRAAFTP